MCIHCGRTNDRSVAENASSICFVMSDNKENTEIISFFINNVELEQNARKTLT